MMVDSNVIVTMITRAVASELDTFSFSFALFF